MSTVQVNRRHSNESGVLGRTAANVPGEFGNEVEFCDIRLGINMVYNDERRVATENE